MSEWISVEDRLPKDEIARWATDGSGLILAIYGGLCPVKLEKYWTAHWFMPGPSVNMRKITHWQEVPAPPEPTP